MIKLFFISLLLCSSSLLSLAQGVSDPCRKSTEGSDFWFGFMESRNYHSAHYLEITVTARENTSFTITIGKDETLVGTYDVTANNSRQVKIDWELVEAIGSEIIEDKGIHLVSEKPVNVYALNWDRNSADVAVIFPIESLGKEYIAMCYDPHIHESNSGNYGNGRNSQFLVVAAEDSTEVIIIPSKRTDKLVQEGDTIVTLLNKGEVYQVQSMNRENLSGQGDLTGSYILSDKPIAFYSGSLGTTVPANQGVTAWDHLYEQIPPVHSWGREYYTVPLQSRRSDRYRIMASEDNTVIQISGRSDIVLNSRKFEEIVLYNDEPSRIFSDKPILVAQYSQSKSVDDTYTGGNGDPFMIILSSTTQAKNDVTFVAYNSDQISRYFVNIISLTSEINNIQFNGQPIAGSFKNFPDSKYSYAQKQISGGTYRIHNIDEDRGFLAYVYGFGGVESYGYGVGFNLDLVLDLGESIDFNGDTLLLCNGESVKLDAGPYFDTYNWNTGDTIQTLEVTSGGNYKVKTTTIDGCELEDSIFVYLSHPVVDLGIDYDEGCEPYSVELNGTDNFQKYVWQNQTNDTLSTNQNYTAHATGEYLLTVFDEYNCPARDTMNFVVFPVPDIKIEGNELVCGTKTTNLSVAISDAPESVWNYDDSYTWSSDNSSVQFTNELHKGTTVEALDWGEYKVYYELKTIDNCYISDTFKVSFRPTPTSYFEFVEDPNDKCKGYSREVLYIGNATEEANFYWDYGGSKLIDSVDWKNFTVSIGAFNTNPYITMYVEENGCWSDTTSMPIGANPDFILETKKTRGCDSMSVLFKGKLNVPDALQFEWDFGDDSPVNYQQEITHVYTDTGFYDVSLTITNIHSGCQIGFQIDSMIKVFPTPTAAITADPDFCFADSAQIIYTYNIDSSLCTWDFVDAYQSGYGNDSVTIILEKPFATAILTVEEYGCTSQPAEITLKRKPHFDFTAETEEGCQPLLVEANADPVDQHLEFTWLTDSLPHPSGNSNLFLLQDSGKINIGLVANSLETGCTDTLVKPEYIWVHPKPLAAFEVDYPVALIEHAKITYTNLTEFASHYFWDFNDGESSLEKNPSHTFTQLGEYNSQLIVESEYGCKDTSEFLIKILPFSVYTPNAFRPESEIHENRTFMPVGVGADPSKFNLKIYDRWGQIIYETNTPESPWDGKTRNGQHAPEGNYIWTSNYYDIQGFEHNQKGQVLLIR